MAQLSPSLPTQRKDAGLARELDVLEHLQQSLPDGFEIFHGVAWHTLYLGSDHHGEIDLVILGPTGNMLLAGSAVWMFTGCMVMRKMINFDF